MIDAVLLLVCTGQLVLADVVILVIVDGGAAYDATKSVILLASA